jgi:hypothetical protein
MGKSMIQIRIFDEKDVLQILVEYQGLLRLFTAISETG